MEAKELMIGNKIYQQFEDGDKKEITATTRDIFDVQVNSTGKFSYYGIPLTEEILLKCGFEKHKDGFYHINGFALCYRDEEKNFYLKDVDFYTSITFLHQLQNLYFALTQTELKIEL